MMRPISTLEPTRYEIAARHPDGRAFLVAYAARQSRVGLLGAMRQRGRAIVERCGIGDDDAIAFASKPRWHATIGNGWSVGFTGRTQRDCRAAGAALPYIESEG